MTDIPLVTKLRAPPLRPALVPRHRLLALLDQVSACPVCLVSAPAGYGKTTLVAAWAARCPLPVAWLALDEADNDLAHFLAYLVAALQRVQIAVGQSTLAMLQGPHPPPLPVLLQPLINELEACRTPVVLVLDDYHLIDAQPVHDVLAFLIDHQPESLHLLIATRADPPLPIARLRGRGQLLELRQADLRFTRDESEAFLSLASGLTLSAADVDELAWRTEGWAAGLQMAAASLKSSPDAGAFVRAFAGTHRHILDYLGEEILQRQPPDVQQFLQRTAILDRLSASLCDAVLNGEPPSAPPGGPPSSPAALPRPSAEILAYLDRANLFVTPLDDQRRWYRYHRLFVDLLRQRLAQAQPALAPVLHARASRWFEAEGLLSEAIDHARAAGDAERAAGLVERAAPAAWKRGSLSTLWAWLQALPEAATRARPVLCVYRSLAAVLVDGSFSQAETWLQAALAADGAGRFQGEVAMLGSIVGMFRGDPSASLRLAEQALATLPESSPFHGLARRGLSGLYLLGGDFSQAAAVLEADVQASLRTGDSLGAAVSRRRLGSLCLLAGQLRAARDHYRRSLEISVDGAGRRWPIAGRTLMHLAELSHEWNDLDEAERLLAESIPLAEQVSPAWNSTAYITLAHVRQARGDPSGALQAIEHAGRLAAQSDTALDDVLVSAHAVRLALAQGDLALARRWAAERSPRPAAGGSARDVEGLLTSVWAQAVGALARARLELAQGQAARAIAAIAPLLAAAERQAPGRSLLEMLVVLALASQSAGDPAAALSYLTRALAQAEPEGYVRLFVDEGQPMARLLEGVTGEQRAYAGRLLAAFQPSPAAAPAVPDSALVEPLTARERDLLRLIADGLSNREIGARLFLAPGTVKSYTYSLYGKLGVHRRTQAVARGRALGLLPRA